MHHLPNEVRANHLSPEFVSHARESLIERMLLSVTGASEAKKVAQESNKASSQMM